MAVAQQTFEELRTAGLADVDPEIADAARARARAPARPDRADRLRELHLAERARGGRVGRRPTSTPRDIPGKRYYGGCEVVDEIEELARDRAKELFGAEHANVQPHAGAQANMAVYFAVLEPGDRVLGLSLDHGGHLTHGLKVNFSGKLYEFHHYGVSRETMQVDYDEVLATAKEVRPALIVCGGSAYPRTVEADKFREIADEVGALLMCDMAHFSGLVAAGLHPSPVPHCDFVTSTSHKTLAGPRAGFVLCREEHASKLDRANFPGMQGGPLMHAIAAKAACFRIAMTDAFKDYQAPGPRERRRARSDADVGRLRRPHRRHRHPSRPARPARDRVDGARRPGAPRGVPADREPQHRAVRRAPADGRLGRPPRHAGRDDARLRRGRLPRGRVDHRRLAGRELERRRRSARARSRSATSGRSTRASAATRTLRRA